MQSYPRPTQTKPILCGIINNMTSPIFGNLKCPELLVSAPWLLTALSDTFRTKRSKRLYDLYTSNEDVVDNVTQIDSNCVKYKNEEYACTFKVIAQGTFGEVYKVTFRIKNQIFCVALKIALDKNSPLDEHKAKKILGRMNLTKSCITYMKPLGKDVVMPLANGDLSDLLRKFNQEELDSICRHLFKILYTLFTHRCFYFDLKTKNVLYNVTGTGTVRLYLGDLGSVVAESDWGYPTTHAYERLQSSGVVYPLRFESVFDLWFVYIYQICLVYCRLFLGYDESPLPVYKNLAKTKQILTALCNKLGNGRSTKKYKEFLMHAAHDLDSTSPCLRKHRVIRFLKRFRPPVKPTQTERCQTERWPTYQVFG